MHRHSNPYSTVVDTPGSAWNRPDPRHFKTWISATPHPLLLTLNWLYLHYYYTVVRPLCLYQGTLANKEKSFILGPRRVPRWRITNFKTSYKFFYLIGTNTVAKFTSLSRVSPLMLVRLLKQTQYIKLWYLRSPREGPYNNLNWNLIRLADKQKIK